MLAIILKHTPIWTYSPEDDADALSQWFIDNFNIQYNGNRAPFGFYVHAAYFNVNPLRLDAYKKFVDYLQGLDDVFLVRKSYKCLNFRHNMLPSLGNPKSSHSVDSESSCYWCSWLAGVSNCRRRGLYTLNMCTRKGWWRKSYIHDILRIWVSCSLSLVG